jgi:hypothetical protein
MAPCRRDLPLVCLALVLPPSPRVGCTRHSAAVRPPSAGSPSRASQFRPFWTFVLILNFLAELYTEQCASASVYWIGEAGLL